MINSQSNQTGIPGVPKIEIFTAQPGWQSVKEYF